MAYFSRFPLMVYDVKNNDNYKLLPDILRRVKIRQKINSSTMLFDKYDVKEGERPEDIAFKYFGDPELHWIILMTNDVTDRYYQWPMNQPQFAEYLTDKYGAGNEDAVHHYESSAPLEKTKDRDKSSSEQTPFWVNRGYSSAYDGTTYNATTISNLDYEDKLNEDVHNSFIFVVQLKEQNILNTLFY